MQVLICDDEAPFLEVLEAHIRDYMRSHYIPCDILATADPVTVANSGRSFDLAFLDIQMDGMDGISLARELRKRNPRTALFFVTNFEEYQDDAMDLRAFRFFEKPFDVRRLNAGLDKAMEYIDGAYVDIFLDDKRTQQRVLVDDILYITRNNRRTELVTKGGSFFSAKSIEIWAEKLPQSFFYPVHKSFLVNLHYVNKNAYSELTLTDGTRIPVAPRRQSAFHKFWFAYLGRQ